jgi:hypothetical protein
VGDCLVAILFIDLCVKGRLLNALTTRGSPEGSCFDGKREPLELTILDVRIHRR